MSDTCQVSGAVPLNVLGQGSSAWKVLVSLVYCKTSVSSRTLPCEVKHETDLEAVKETKTILVFHSYLEKQPC